MQIKMDFFWKMEKIIQDKISGNGQRWEDEEDKKSRINARSIDAIHAAWATPALRPSGRGGAADIPECHSGQ